MLKIKIIDLDFQTLRLTESNYTKSILYFDNEKCVVDVFGNAETTLMANIDRAVVDPSYCSGSNKRFVIQYILLTDFQAKQKIKELVEQQIKLHQEISQSIREIWNNNQPINLNI